MDRVRAAQSGDKVAFGVLIEEYNDMVHRAAFRMMGDEELAHDLAQETFLQAYLSLGSLRDSAYFKSWLYGITLNVCRAYLRSRREVYSLETALGGIHRELIDHSPSPEEIAERLELRQIVFEALAKLSQANREAVMLFYYEGFSLQEAADVLNISVTAMKGRLYKAREQLRSSLLSVYTEEKGTKTMIPVKLVDVMIQESKRDNGTTIIFAQLILFDETSRRAVVIWVGESDGFAIASALNNETSPRPMTQEFIVRLMEATGAAVEAVEISTLKDEIFYATVRVRSTNGMKEVDARPSDALGLAVRLKTPIYVSEEVLERVGYVISSGQSPTGKGLRSIQAYIERLQTEENKRRKRIAHEHSSEQSQREHDREIQAILMAAFES